MRILLTGATGFVGRQLVKRLTASGHTCQALSRDPVSAAATPGLAHAWSWEPTAGPPPPAALDGVEAVIHLAGESVVGRWTSAKRKAIRDSRVLGTRHLVQALEAAPERPRVLVTASAIGYFGDRGDEELVEDAPPGSDFLAEVCQSWEAEARRAEALLPVLRLRIGLVLGREGGALAAMHRPFSLGLGGPLGGGRQWWSWIHQADLLDVVERGLTARESAVWNATAPTPVRQAEFARTLGRVLGRPALLPGPAAALRLALGGMADELLASRRVLPAALQQSGHPFRFPELRAALANLLGERALA